MFRREQPSLRSELLLTDLDGDPADFQQFLNGDGSRLSRPDGVNKGGDAGPLALVLRPEIHPAETWPTVATQLAKVIELQNTPRTEDFQALFRKGLMTIGQVMNRAERTVSKAQRERCFVARHSYARIISQGCAFSEALVADPVIASRIEPFLGKIKAREESMLLRALYHNGHGAEFRRRYQRAVRSGSIDVTWRWRRRYAASFFAWI